MAPAGVGLASLCLEGVSPPSGKPETPFSRHCHDRLCSEGLSQARSGSELPGYCETAAAASLLGHCGCPCLSSEWVHWDESLSQLLRLI